jgi:hypothetical protein
VKDSVLAIDRQMARRKVPPQNRMERTTNYLVEVSKGSVSSTYSRHSVSAIAITIGAWFVTSAYGAVVGAIAKTGMEPAGKHSTSY